MFLLGRGGDVPREALQGLSVIQKAQGRQVLLRVGRRGGSEGSAKVGVCQFQEICADAAALQEHAAHWRKLILHSVFNKQTISHNNALYCLFLHCL